MLVINRNNISVAWAETLTKLIDRSGTEVNPLVVNISLEDDAPLEDVTIRAALDRALAAAGLQSVQTVANTIFPERLWRISRGNRQDLYRLYKNNLPRYKQLEPVLNRRGLYFERLIDFGCDAFDGNQLEYIIRSYTDRDGVRRSKFQAAIFDPHRDHVPDARLIFPCLQHISLVPVGRDLTLNAFYATQQLFPKAYGNFLGLVRLGKFMAGEMGLTLKTFSCLVGVEKIGATKAAVRPLANELRGLII